MHVERARADRVAAGQRDLRLAGAGQQRAEHADRAADLADQVVGRLGARVPRACARLPGRSPPCADSVTSQPSRSSNSRMIATSEIAGRLPSVVSPGRQQRGRHQLEHAVLRADDVDTARQPGAAGHPQNLHPDRLAASPWPAAGTLEGRAMAVHLTRIYTKTGDDGTTALGDMSRVAKTDPRVGAYADCDETNAALGVALALGELPARIAAVLRDRAERPVRRRRRPVHPGRRRPGVPAAADRRSPTSSGSRAGATSSTPNCPSWTASSCPAARPARRCCTRPGPSPGGPSAAGGRCSRPTRNGPTSRRCSTSTGSRICCSS